MASSSGPGKVATRPEKDEYELEDDFDIGTSVATCSATVRVGFIRKVYGIVSIQLLTTVVISLCVMLSTIVRTFVLDSANTILLSMFASFVVFFVLLKYKDRHPTNIYLLAVFTFAESYVVAWICAINYETGYGHCIATAFSLTLMIFSSLTVFCFVTKKDFSFLGGFLFASIVALFCAGLFFGLATGYGGKIPPVLSFLYSFLGTIVFSAHILFDTSLLIHRLSPDDYILAAVSIYLDVINLFVHILRVSRQSDN
ncbi:hypothetical protein NDN08_005891 [Rhodosorus marinus]|uniref:Transmembrane BAX inhibitor motif-containing protein 4 n=1 Tax=Rhodosorus marinus TaxID=101924 RepID=A0AAV8V2W7_9RHOD|nr:hypothetical protein NDN08_005891 [Rhodosorus marinus]